jgi:hypothetical protein
MFAAFRWECVCTDDVKLLKYQTAMDESLYRSMQEQINDTDDSLSWK